MSQRPDTPILDQVETPADLKRFSDEELKLLADELRKETIAAVSVWIVIARQRSFMSFAFPGMLTGSTPLPIPPSGIRAFGSLRTFFKTYEIAALPSDVLRIPLNRF